MTSNNFRSIPKTRRQGFAEFDRLEPWLREKLRNLPFNAAVDSRISPSAMDAAIERALRQFALSTERTYGREHPQALSRLPAAGASDELGF
jgi:hypothetical protein